MRVSKILLIHVSTEVSTTSVYNMSTYQQDQPMKRNKKRKFASKPMISTSEAKKLALKYKFEVQNAKFVKSLDCKLAIHKLPDSVLFFIPNQSTSISENNANATSSMKYKNKKQKTKTSDKTSNSIQQDQPMKRNKKRKFASKPMNSTSEAKKFALKYRCEVQIEKISNNMLLKKNIQSNEEKSSTLMKPKEDVKVKDEDAKFVKSLDCKLKPKEEHVFWDDDWVPDDCNVNNIKSNEENPSSMMKLKEEHVFWDDDWVPDDCNVNNIQSNEENPSSMMKPKEEPVFLEDDFHHVQNENVQQNDGVQVLWFMDQFLNQNEMFQRTLNAMEDSRQDRHTLFEQKSQKRCHILAGKLSEIQPVLNEVRENADNFKEAVQNNIQAENSEMFINFDEFHSESLNAQTETIVKRLKNENVTFHPDVKCDYCDKEFITTVGLKRHIVRCHFPEMSFKRIQMACGIEGCRVKSRIPEVMTSHKKEHSNGKIKFSKVFSYPCLRSVCDFSTTRQKEYMKHLSHHNIHVDSPEVEDLIHNISEWDKDHLTKKGIKIEKNTSLLWSKNGLW